MTFLLLAAGLVLLTAGGELLVRGSARLALAFGISPLVIGLTVVAFGTSAPELAVSIRAGLGGSSDIAVGNVVGSNIFNVLFILGVSSALVPLVVSQRLVRMDVPIMIGFSLVLFAFVQDGGVGRLEALFLVIALVGYVTMQIVLSRRSDTHPETEAYSGRWYLDVALILVGLTLLVLGARWFVDAAVTLARLLGVTELVIGLTIVAAGTSMPEVATSIIAGLRGQRDIAVGNVIGSNIFNILAVLGITGVVASGGIPVSTAAATMDVPVMLAVAVMCLPIFFSGHMISRWEGLLFLAYYGLYTTYLILDAAQHAGLSEYRQLMLTVVVPITVATVLGAAFRSWREQRNR